MIHRIWFTIILSFFISSCSMDETSLTDPNREQVFDSEDGMEAYTKSFYDILPTANQQGVIEQNLVDYGAVTSLNDFVQRGAYSEDNSSGWDWGGLRNVNYFLDNLDDDSFGSDIPDDVINNYRGIARFFRAWFYYDKVKRFGDVPWIDHALDKDEEDILFGTRDSRQEVMENVYADLEYAEENIKRTENGGQSTLVSKWTAYAFASRIALFEGSFRKYHNLDLETTSEEWFKRARDAAKEVMEESGKSLNSNYRELFSSDDPPANETILALASDESLDAKNNINWKWNSETYASAMNLIRPFVNTYLQKDGTPYTDRSGWEHEDFYEEFQDRDERMEATLRHPGYIREGDLYLPQLDGYARLGYQPIKLTEDATKGDDQAESTQAIQLIRYGEILLNYAEAKAELGTLSDDDWSMTIGALRERAGITGGLNSKPTEVDDHFRDTYFPHINDPVLLEIRRERGVELVLEGFRFDDLRRWKRGDLFKMKWTGMYISNINKPLDIDHDGEDDVIYYTDDEGKSKAESEANTSDIMKVRVSTNSDSDEIQVESIDGGKGYHLTWFTNKESDKVWGPKQYLYPIPVEALNENDNLEQNNGWKDGATNNGD